MFTIRKADTADCQLINKLAWQVFPETYKDILTPAQIDYMMDWMYSPENIRKQMEEEGHVYLLAYEECEAAGYVSVQPEGEDLFHLQKIYVLPYFQKAHCGSFLFREAIKYIKEVHPAPCRMEKRLLHERLYHGNGDIKKVGQENPAPLFYISDSFLSHLFQLLHYGEDEQGSQQTKYHQYAPYNP